MSRLLLIAAMLLLVCSSLDCGGDRHPTALAVNTDGATDITSTEAVLHGTLQALGGASKVSVYFEVRTSPDAADTWTGVLSDYYVSPGEFAIVYSPATPNTTYYYRAVACDPSQDLVAYGAEETFTTLASP